MLSVFNPSFDPFYNQALEEYIFNQYPDDDIFFLWRNKPAVIVGSHQNICGEVHMPSMMELDIPVIRRMSGGGTVYHDLGNINYTYISSQEGFVDYEYYMKPVIDGLNRLGIPAYKDRTCDISLKGRKISGSAQRNARGRVLHHGTLLFDADLNILDKITTKHKNPSFQSRGTVSAITPVTNIKNHLVESMSIEDFMNTLLREVLLQETSFIDLTEQDKIEIERLSKEKYQSWEWTWGKTPQFHYEKQGIYLGRPIYVTYQTKKGIVTEVDIKSDFVDRQLARELLNESRLDPWAFRDICLELATNQTEAADQLLNILL